MTQVPDTRGDAGSDGPIFKRCARCGYSLRGLGVEHACPECGLRYDARCALFKVRNPKAAFVFTLAILGGGWVSLKHLPLLGSLETATTWQKVGVVAGLLWIVFASAGLWFAIRRYRRGLEVAITVDGLIVRLPGFSDDLVPWDDIESASVADRPKDKPQAATVVRRGSKKKLGIGGVVDVFPTPEDVRRFVDEVNARAAAARATSAD